MLEPLWNIESPGHDRASLDNTDQSNGSGRYYGGHIGREGQYLDTFVEKIERVLGETVEQDEQASKDVKEQGGSIY